MWWKSYTGHQAVLPPVSTRGNICRYSESVDEKQNNLVVSLKKHWSEIPTSWQREISKLKRRVETKCMMLASGTLHKAVLPTSTHQCARSWSQDWGIREEIQGEAKIYEESLEELCHCGWLLSKWLGDDTRLGDDTKLALMEGEERSGEAMISYYLKYWVHSWSTHYGKYMVAL